MKTAIIDVDLLSSVPPQPSLTLPHSVIGGVPVQRSSRLITSEVNAILTNLQLLMPPSPQPCGRIACGATMEVGKTAVSSSATFEGDLKGGGGDKTVLGTASEHSKDEAVSAALAPVVAGGGSGRGYSSGRAGSWSSFM